MELKILYWFTPKSIKIPIALEVDMLKAKAMLIFLEFWNENPIYVFPEKELSGLSPYFHIYVSVSDLYSQDQSTYFTAAE